MSVEPSHDICVIIPTIRDYECLETYVENARTHGFDLSRLYVLLITEDFCDTDAMESMLTATGVAGQVFDGSCREQWFTEHDIDEYTHLIPEASHAETSFGLLYMWANPQFEYGIFIDDDTLPHPDHDFFGTHLQNLAYENTLPAVESDKQWVNVLYQGENDLYPRGYPYSAMDEERQVQPQYVDNVVASQGLWTNVPDLDAVRILMDGDLQGQAQTRTTTGDFNDDFVAAERNYLTVCSMNLAFKREVIPAFYQFPMDDNRWDVGRFDDIWSGVVLKRACDILDKHVYNGAPLCEHNKAPRSTFDDLQNEVAGLELNEHFWKIVDDTGDDATSYSAVAQAIADELAAGDWSEWNNGEFLNYCGVYMQDWLDCLDTIATRSISEQPLVSDD